MAPAPAPAELLARGRDTAVVVGEYALETAWAVTHPEWRRSGATPEEEAEALPGDDLVPEPNWAATRAETIPAAPERVWPWLAQMGYGRGGWYGDFPWWGDPAGHRGRRSAADRILPEHQQLAVGDVLLDGRNCSPEVGAWYVRAVDPGHHLVLFSSRTLAGREVAFLPARPRSYFDCSWSFVLRPTPDGGSRLLVRSRVRYHPAWVLRVVSVVRAGDTVMQQAMLSGIRRRATEPSGDETAAAVPGPGTPTWPADAAFATHPVRARGRHPVRGPRGVAAAPHPREARRPLGAPRPRAHDPGQEDGAYPGGPAAVLPRRLLDGRGRREQRHAAGTRLVPQPGRRPACRRRRRWATAARPCPRPRSRGGGGALATGARRGAGLRALPRAHEPDHPARPARP